MSSLAEEKELIKLEKKFGPDFTRELRQMDKGQLDAKLLELAKYRTSIIDTKAKDRELELAKARASSLEKPYSDDLKANLEKQRFITLVMKDEGMLEDKFLSKENDEE